MKYVDEFRRHDLAQKLSRAIHNEVDRGRQYNLMEFCGGHTHTIFRYGVQDLMPDNVRFVHGLAARYACCRSGASTTPFNSRNSMMSSCAPTVTCCACPAAGARAC